MKAWCPSGGLRLLELSHNRMQKKWAKKIPGLGRGLMSQGASTSYYYWFDLLHPERRANFLSAPFELVLMVQLGQEGHSLSLCELLLEVLMNWTFPHDRMQQKWAKKIPSRWPRINESGCIYQLLLLVLSATPGTTGELFISSI